MPSDTIKVVRGFVAAVNRQSVREIGELLSEDHVFIDPQGRTQRGRDAMLAGWEAYFTMFPDYEIRIDTLLADGDLVAAFGEAAGTFRTPRGLLPQNRIVMPAAWKACVKNDRVALWQVYADWSEGIQVIERANMDNASREPPPTADTRAAEQPLAPPAGVAHL